MKHAPATIALIAASLASNVALAQSEATQPAVAITAPAAPRPVAYAPPGYAYGYEAERPRIATAVRVYDDLGGALPPEARRETRPSMGAIAAGAITLGVFYTGSLFVALGTCGIGTDCSNGHGALYVPFVGPFIAAAQAPTSGGATLATFDGVVQTLSLATMIAGYVIRHPVVVVPSYASNAPRRLDRSARFALLPAAQGATVGATLSVATF